jgi:hypothetical protein
MDILLKKYQNTTVCIIKNTVKIYNIVFIVPFQGTNLIGENKKIKVSGSIYGPQYKHTFHMWPGIKKKLGHA